MATNNGADPINYKYGSNTQPGANNPFYIDPNNPMMHNQGYVDLFDQGGGNGISADFFKNKLTDFGTQFGGAFKNATGQEAGSSDFDKFYRDLVQTNITGGGKGLMGTNYADVQNLINPYLQNQYGGQIQGYQQQQQQDQLKRSQGTVQDLVNQQNQASIQNLLSPQVMEQFKQGLNNSGQLDSGAFSTQLANRLAQGANANESAALGAVGLPQISQMAGTANAPYEQFLQQMNPGLQNFGGGATAFNDFQMQSDLANRMQSKPSFMEQYGPLIGASLNAAGDVGAAAMGKPSPASPGGGITFICTAMKEAGVLSEDEVQKVHDHLFPMAPNRLMHLFEYFAKGPVLVKRVLEKGIDLKKWREFFFDRVVAEPDKEKSVDLYADAFRMLWKEAF